MMETKDFISFIVGLLLTIMGAFPLLNKMGVGPEWFALSKLPVSIFAYIVAGAGFYLLVNSVIEITNSNSVGWISFLIALVFLGVGLLQTLFAFGIGPSWFELDIITNTIYYVIFTIEGIFLMIACFAMEL